MTGRIPNSIVSHGNALPVSIHAQSDDWANPGLSLTRPKLMRVSIHAQSDDWANHGVRVGQAGQDRFQSTPNQMTGRINVLLERIL